MPTPTLHFRRRWSVSDEHDSDERRDSPHVRAPRGADHRGAHEIGGNCVELRHGQDTLILDIGKSLTAAWGEVVPLPAAIGLDENGSRPLSVIISHGHQDHWGLAPQLPTDIPVFIGEGAADILRAAQFWGSGVDLHEAGHLHDRVPFALGPFTITPYLADHSAYDAFSLLIEAGEGLLPGGAVVWSILDGYLGESSGQRLKAAPRAANTPLIQHHTSGHATPADLARLVNALHRMRSYPSTPKPPTRTRPPSVRSFSRPRMAPGGRPKEEQRRDPAGGLHGLPSRR
jgi:L-ascorbate metabolism protein UlaG (beta-lactamase superfamily)